MDAAPQYLSLQDLSKFSSLSVRTLRSYLQHAQHPLPHYKLPGKILIRVDEFDSWIECYRRGEPGDQAPDIDQLVNSLMRGLQSPTKRRS